MNTYVAGSKVRLYNGTGFLDSVGALVDPSTVAVKYQLPGQAAVTKSYPADVVKDSTGLYHYDVDTTGLVGVMNYEWLSTGTGQAIQPNKLEITPAPI